MNTWAGVPHRALQCCLLWAQGDGRVQLGPVPVPKVPPWFLQLFPAPPAAAGALQALHPQPPVPGCSQRLSLTPAHLGTDGPAARLDFRQQKVLGMPGNERGDSQAVLEIFPFIPQMPGNACTHPIPTEEMCADMRELFR